MTWMVFLLPQMEQGPLFNSYNQALPSDVYLASGQPITGDPSGFTPSGGPVVENQTLRTAFVNAYLCPSGLNNNQLEVPASGPGAAAGLLYAPASYKGVGGADNPTYGDGSPGAYIWWDDVGGSSVNDWGKLHWKGVFHNCAPVNSGPGKTAIGPESIATISDGTANTVAVAEYTTKTNNRRRVFWSYVYTSYVIGTAMPESRTLIPDYDKCNVAGSDSNPCKRSFGSLHPGGMNTLHADGSVHFLKQTINLKIWQALATIGANEVISADAL